MHLTVRISGRRVVDVDVGSYEEASKLTRSAIEEENVGSSQFDGAILRMGTKLLGHISYNGRVWKGAQRATGLPELLFEPTARWAMRARWVSSRKKTKARARGVELSVPRTREWATRVSREIKVEGGEAEEKLAAKCRWEHMTRTAVILEWGDPRGW